MFDAEAQESTSTIDAAGAAVGTPRALDLVVERNPPVAAGTHQLDLALPAGGGHPAKAPGAHK